MRRAIVVMSLALACAMLGGCASPQVQQPDATQIEQGEEEAMREYATVEEVGEGYLVVKTTTDELYQIDAQFDEDFEVGSLVLVVYKPDQKVKDGDRYRVSPLRVEASSTDVVDTME